MYVCCYNTYFLALWFEKVLYLDVEVNEENYECEHVAGLEKQAANREAAWNDNSTQRVADCQEKLNLK